MPKIDLVDLEGKKKASRNLSDDVFAVTTNPMVIAHAVRYYRNRKRAGTASVLTRANVRGTGKKMWAQKHTGRARHSDAQAPQFTGGGRAHGPHPHRASIRFPHQLRRLALKAALSDRLRSGQLRLLALPALEQPSTKIFRGFQQRAGLPNGSLLFVFEPEATTAYLSVNNLPRVSARRAMSLTAYDVIASKSIVMTDKAAEILTTRLTEAAHG